MAADKSLFHFLPVIKTSASSSSLIAFEDKVIGNSQSAPADLNHNAEVAAAANFYVESELHQTNSRACDSINRSAPIFSRAPSPPVILCASDVNHTSTHSFPPFLEGHCPGALKRTVVDCAALQLQAHADDNDLELVALDDIHGEHTSSHIMQCLGEKFCACRQKSCTVKEEDEKEQDGEGDQENEEEGCVTPTGRGQRIPQYNIELHTSGLVCPPAPKKKPYVSKRRRLFYSANDAGADVSYHIAAERRTFLVDPPDLHNFPDCIKALFK